MTAVAFEAQRPRLGVQGTALLGVALLLLAVAGLGVWRFITPTVSHEVRLGPAASFERGSVTSFVYDGERLRPYQRNVSVTNWQWPIRFPLPAGEFVHVVRLPDGQLRVLAGVSPHRGQRVLWFPEARIEVGQSQGFFGDNFSWWLVDGTRTFGPAPRDLPTYRYRVDEGGTLVIDLSEPIEGEWLPDRWESGTTREVPPPYDVLDPGWATSGWPSASSR